MKILFPFFILSFCSIIGVAQANLDFNSGFNIATARLTNFKDSTAKVGGLLGYQAGVNLNWLQKDKGLFRGVSIGLQYQKISYNENDPTITIQNSPSGLLSSSKSTLNYLNLPLVADFNLLHAGRFTWRAGVGLQVGLLLSYTRQAFITTDPQLLYYQEYDEIIKGKEFKYTVTGYDKSIDPSRPVTNSLSETATMSQPIYNKILLSGVLNTTLQYKISQKISLSTCLGISYSFSDAEKKGDIGVKGQLQQLLIPIDNYWGDGRGNFHLLVPSLNLGISYSL